MNAQQLVEKVDQRGCSAIGFFNKLPVKRASVAWAYKRILVIYQM
jgi:hypothetical protein